MTAKAPPPEKPTVGPPEWTADDWEAARRRKLTLGLEAAPAERLAWLEAAIAFAWSSGALPRARE